jgi:uncharacterized protein (TIGR03435 family)
VVSSTAPAILLLAASALAQPRFEAASIKPASSAELDAIKRSGRSRLFPEQGISVSGNRVTVLGLTPYTLIRAAFSLRAAQLSNAPDWTANESCDISAEGLQQLLWKSAGGSTGAILAQSHDLPHV